MNLRSVGRCSSESLAAVRVDPLAESRFAAERFVSLAAAAAAHIHRGDTGASRGAILVNSILADPASYHVNVRTAEFPNGPIRGQLTGTSTDSFGKILMLQLQGASEPNAKGTAE